MLTVSCVSLTDRMPRKKGIAESRKGKRRPPPKPQEKAKASTMPDDTASEHESTASGGNSPVDELDGMAADVSPVSKAAHEAIKRLEQAVDDIDATHDEYMYEEAMYNFSKTCISATTRARGEAATREAALLAENKVLKATKEQDVKYLTLGRALYRGPLLWKAITRPHKATIRLR